MSKQTRMNRIIEIVKDRHGESIRELARQLGVTEMTIRRDIEKLKASRIVKVVSGAVVYDGDDRYDLDVQKGKHASEKLKAGKLAASLVEPGDVIFVDIGTTTFNIIKHIPTSTPVVIICCTMNALLEVQKRGMENVIFIGGNYHPDVQVFESKEGIELLGRTRVNKAFISAAGVSEKLGATCINNYEVDTKQTAMKSAQQKILVADSSKFGAVKPAYYARLEDFDAIVTDGELPREWREKIAELGIKLYLA